MRFDERDADEHLPIFIAGEFRLPLNGEQTNPDKYMQVYNRNRDTTVPYTMYIERDDSYTQRDAGN